MFKEHVARSVQPIKATSVKKDTRPSPFVQIAKEKVPNSKLLLIAGAAAYRLSVERARPATSEPRTFLPPLWAPEFLGRAAAHKDGEKEGMEK